MDTLGAVLGPLTALLLVTFLDYRAIFLISVIPGVLSALSIWLIREKKKTAGHQTGLLLTIKGSPPQFNKFLSAVGIFGLGNFAHSLLIFYVNQLLTPFYGAKATASMAIFLYTLHNIIYALTSYPFGALSDRVGKYGLLAIGYFLFGVMSLGFAFAGPHVPALVVLFILAGVYIAIIDTVEGAIAAELLPETIRGTGYGMLSTVNGIGDFVSSAVVGFLLANVSALAVFGYAFVLSLLGAALLFAQIKKGSGELKV